MLVHGRQKKERRGADREREWGKEKEKKKKRERTEKEKDFGFCSNFKISNLYPFQIFGFQPHFYEILVIFSIFSKYDAKMNF